MPNTNLDIKPNPDALVVALLGRVDNSDNNETSNNSENSNNKDSVTSMLPQAAPYLTSALEALSAPKLTQLYLNTALSSEDSTPLITQFIDGRGLSCPMPLLKTKVALRQVPSGHALYVIATDPHSQADITAFSQQSGYMLLLNSSANLGTDTIYHFIITKTDSN